MSILLVRPCAGDEPWLERTLASSARAVRPGVTIRFAVTSLEDPAARKAARVASRMTRAGADAGVDLTSARGPNHKAAQLARVLEDEPRSDFVVVADSDVELEEGTLGALLAPLERDPAVAASWAPPIETEPETRADHASAAILDASLHSFALLSRLDGGGMVGKLFCVRTAALEATGGFASLTGVLGEDVELARRLRAQGLRVAVADARARSLVRGRSWRNVADRYARWIHVVRAQRPQLLASYPVMFAIAPPALTAGIAAIALGRPWQGSVAIATTILARIIVALLAKRVSRTRFSPLIAVHALAADALLLWAFFQALGSDRFCWRGRWLRHAEGGRIEEETAPPPSRAAWARHPREGARREREEEAFALGMKCPEPRLGPPHDRHVDVVELPGHGLLERPRYTGDVASRRDGIAERHVEHRVGPRSHLVAQRARDERGSPCDPRDRGRAPAKAERPYRDGHLASLREDPDDTARPLEQCGRVSDGAHPVRRVVEVDPERPDLAEEGQRPQVPRVHHGVGAERAHAPAQVHDHERVPPGRMVRDDHDGPLANGAVEMLETSRDNAVEAASDAMLGVPREPPSEPAAAIGADHLSGPAGVG